MRAAKSVGNNKIQLEGMEALGEMLKVNRGLRILGLSNLAKSLGGAINEKKGAILLLDGLSMNGTLTELDICRRWIIVV